MKKPYKPKKVKLGQYPNDWITEIKYDGERNLLIIKDGKVIIKRHEGRQKTDFYPEIVEYIENNDIPNMVLDGEICILENHRKANFSALQSRVNLQDDFKRKLLMQKHQVKFVAFDIIEYNNEDLREMPFGERRKILENEMSIKPITSFDKSGLLKTQACDGKTSINLWKEVKELNLEGLVIKNPNVPYDWVKVKNWDEDDFKIVGFGKLTPEAKKRGWLVSTLTLEDTEGKHIDKGMTCDCKYINYPQQKDFIESLIGKTAIVKYMKMKDSNGNYQAPRFPSLVKILEV